MLLVGRQHLLLLLPPQEAAYADQGLLPRVMQRQQRCAVQKHQLEADNFLRHRDHCPDRPRAFARGQRASVGRQGQPDRGDRSVGLGSSLFSFTHLCLHFFKVACLNFLLDQACRDVGAPAY